MPTDEATGRRRTPGQSSAVGLVTWLSIALSAAFLIGREARAQMLPFVPDPVTTPEFVRYADMLGLSNEQRLAALDIHDAYRTEFRALEDDEVKAFVRHLTGLVRVFMQGGWRFPERSEFEHLIEELDGIITKAKTIDRSLMDHLVPLLTEDQLVRLPSVRIERELDVYAHLMDGLSGLNPAAPVILSSMVRELDRNDEEVARTEDLLRQYERNALQRTRKLYRLLQEAATLALDTIDRLGVRDMTAIEMMQLGEDDAFEADMRATFNEGSRPLQAELFAASQQNLELLRRLTPLLSPEHADTLRETYYRAAYGRVYRQRSPWRLAYEMASALESLEAERRTQIGAQQAGFRRQEDRVIDDMVRRLEAWREYRTIAQLDEEDVDDLEQRIAACREDRERIDESALAALRAILTGEEWVSVEPGSQDGSDAADATVPGRVVVGVGGGGEVEAEVVVDEAGTDVMVRPDVPGIPPAMSLERRDALTRLAGLDEGQQAIMESLFDDYRAGYAAALGRMAQEDAQEDEADGETKDETNGAASEPKEREDRFVSRLATVASLDDALFESAKVALEGEAARVALEIGQQLRARERATIATQASRFVFGREESYVDLVGVIVSMEPSAEIVAATRPGLESYGESVRPLVEERLAAARDAERQFRMALRAEEHGRAGRRMAKKIEERADEARQQARRLDRRIRDQNRQLLAEAQSALGSDLGWTLRVAYQRAAYPEIYEDELGVDDAMAAVQSLDDLTAPQRRQVETIVTDYRASFSKLSERMVRLRGRREIDLSAMQMPSQKAIEGEIELERLRFDRREAASRAILRLRLVLTGPQIARCGIRALPMPDRRSFD